MQEIIREDGLQSGAADGYANGYADSTNPQGQQLLDSPALVAEAPVGVQVLKVSARSQPSMLAGAIAGCCAWAISRNSRQSARAR